MMIPQQKTTPKHSQEDLSIHAIPASSAPGKLLIVGEYAVREGAPSIVTTVNSRAYVSACKGSHESYTVSDDATRSGHLPLPKEVLATRAIFEEEHGSTFRSLVLDVRCLRSGGKKIGLGSSAAACAATSHCLLHSIVSKQEITSRMIFSYAYAGHKRIAPQGSGADIAASCFGGTLVFHKHHEDMPQVVQIEHPSNLIVRVLWTKKVVRTNDFLERLRSFEATYKKEYQKHMEVMGESSRRFIHAWTSGHHAQLIDETKTYMHLMRTLGAKADIPIVEETLSRIEELARDYGGACKPSGAGGGDVALALFIDSQACRSFDEACQKEGFERLPLSLHERGPRSEKHVFD